MKIELKQIWTKNWVKKNDAGCTWSSLNLYSSTNFGKIQLTECMFYPFAPNSPFLDPLKTSQALLYIFENQFYLRIRVKMVMTLNITLDWHNCKWELVWRRDSLSNTPEFKISFSFLITKRSEPSMSEHCCFKKSSFTFPLSETDFQELLQPS